MQWAVFVVPKADEVAGGWRMVRGKEFLHLYCWTDIVRVIVPRACASGHVMSLSFYIPQGIFVPSVSDKFLYAFLRFLLRAT